MLTPQQKAAIDNMALAEKAEAVFYIFGIDNPTIMVKVAEAFAKQFFNLDPTTLTNDQKGLAFLLTLRRMGKREYLGIAAAQAANAAHDQAEQEADTETQWGDIGELPT